MEWHATLNLVAGHSSQAELLLQVGRAELPSDIFGVEVRKDILHRVVRWQRAKKQQVWTFKSQIG